METVGSTPDGMTAKQIARRCQLNLPTAYHLVRTLVYEGYLIRGDAGRYQVGLAVSDRYADLANTMRGPSTVAEVLRRTVGDTGYSHFLGRIVDGRAAVTAVSEGARSPHVEDLIVGFDDGAHAHALGKALLATMSPQERSGYIRESGMRRYTDFTVTELDALEHDLANLTTRGVYTEVGQFYPGVGCAATVVRDDPDPRHRTVIACTMPIHELRWNGKLMKTRLRRAAEELKALL
jgi:DNA-binding IclR family transcriptional regulator